MKEWLASRHRHYGHAISSDIKVKKQNGRNTFIQSFREKNTYREGYPTMILVKRSTTNPDLRVRDSLNQVSSLPKLRNHGKNLMLLKKWLKYGCFQK